MQELKQTYLCLQAQVYQIDEKDEKGNSTGRRIEGVSIRYIPDDNLTPRVDEIAYDRGQDSRGIKPAKASLPMSAASQLREFPGLYEMTMEMRTVGDKVQVAPKSIRFVSEVKLEKAS